MIIIKFINTSSNPTSSNMLAITDSGANIHVENKSLLKWNLYYEKWYESNDRVEE